MFSLRVQHFLGAPEIGPKDMEECPEERKALLDSEMVNLSVAPCN